MGIQKDDAFQIRQKFLNWFVKQIGHVVEVNAAALIQRDQQRLLWRANRLDRLPVMNRAFSKNCGLGRPFGFVVVIFQREQQRQIRVAVEGALVCPEIYRAEPSRKTVVSQIELLPGFDDVLLGAAVHLRTQAITHRIAHRNQMPDARPHLSRQIRHRSQNIFFTDAHHALVQTVSIWLNEIGRGDGLFDTRFRQLDPLCVIHS